MIKYEMKGSGKYVYKAIILAHITVEEIYTHMHEYQVKVFGVK